MIKEVKDREKIVKLWQKAFGDSDEEIYFFTDNVKNAKCIGYFDNDKLLSMLYLENCELDNKPARYIYAACTLKAYKRNGYMTKLLDYCKENYSRLCLIPANDGLIDYYKVRGFDKSADINNINFDETEEIKEYLLEGYCLTNPSAMLYERI